MESPMKISAEEEETLLLKEQEDKKGVGKVTFVLLFATFLIFLPQFQVGYGFGELNSSENFIPVYVPSNYSAHEQPVIYNEHNKRCGNMDKWFKDCIPFQKKLENTFGDPWTWLVSVFPFGGFIGAFCALPIGTYLGRKYTLFVSGLCFALSYLLKDLFSGFWPFLIGRLFTGIASGMSTATGGAFLSEIAPKRWRGAFGFVPQIGINAGLVTAQALSIGTAKGQWWRFLIGIIMITAIVLCIFINFIPFSPRWLLSWNTKWAINFAKKNLKFLRGKNSDVSVELTEMKKELNKVEIAMPKNKVILHFVIVLGLQVIQQFSGINAVAFYSTKVFNSTSIKFLSPEIITVLTTTMRLISVCTSMWFVDKIGRKILLLVGMALQFVALTILTGAFCALHYGRHIGDGWNWTFGIIAILAILMYCFCFALALGPVPWFIFGEMFTTKWRVLAGVLCSALNWGGAVVIGLIFPVMNHYMTHFSFVPFAVVLLFAFFFVLFLLKETKGKSIEEICYGPGKANESIPDGYGNTSIQDEDVTE